MDDTMDKTPSKMPTSRLLLIGVILVGLIGAAAALFFPKTKEKAEPILAKDEILILRTPGGMLEVATLVRNEEFRWSTEYNCPLVDCGSLLGKTISDVRVPVHYTYRIPLAKEWSLTVKDVHFELVVPNLEPKLPAAIEVAKLEIRTDTKWFSPSKTPHRESVIRNLGPEFDRRATQSKYVDAIRDDAKKAVAEFATKWMIEQGVEPKLRGYQVRVSFPDDTH